MKRSDFPDILNHNHPSLKINSLTQLHRVLPTILSIARSCPLEYRYPILKLLKELSKTFILNEFQATFFAYLVRETKWNFKEQLITKNSEEVNPILGNIYHHGEFKSVVLYLVLLIFTLKKFLNEHSQFFLEEAMQISPNFVTLFQKWSKKHQKLTKKFNPKTLNKIYRDVNYNTEQQKPNFNILVDSIMQISPPYNPDFIKNKKSQNEEKLCKQKINPHNDKQSNKVTFVGESNSILKSEDNNSLEVIPVFSTERIHEMVEGVCVQKSMIEVSDFEAFGLTKFKNINYNFDHSLFGSSENSADQNFYLKDQEYFCYELKVGLEDGESQQNAKIDDKIPDCPQNIPLSESRFNITDQYLNWKIQGQEYNYY